MLPYFLWPTVTSTPIINDCSTRIPYFSTPNCTPCSSQCTYPPLDSICMSTVLMLVPDQGSKTVNPPSWRFLIHVSSFYSQLSCLLASSWLSIHHCFHPIRTILDVPHLTHSAMSNIVGTPTTTCTPSHHHPGTDIFIFFLKRSFTNSSWFHTIFEQMKLLWISIRVLDQANLDMIMR